jgi:hypothetical protein
MYASIRKYTAESPAEVAQLVKEQFIPRISKISGFLSYYVIDLGTGIATVSIFETKEGEEESNKAAAGWVKESLSGKLGPVAITVGEVLAHSAKQDTP